MQHPVHVRLAITDCPSIATTCLCTTRCTGNQPNRPPPVNPTYCQNRDIDLPTTTDLSYQQRSSSCIQQLNRPQLPAMIIQLYPTTRPISASRYDRPAAFSDLTDNYPHQTSSCISTTRPTPATLTEHPTSHIYDLTIPVIDITHLAEDPNTTATDFTHTFVILTINCHPCCICYLTFVSFIVFSYHYSHALNLKKHLLGRHAYRLRNLLTSTWNNELQYTVLPVYKVEFKGLTGVLKKISGILWLTLSELLMSLPHGTPGGIYLTGFWILDFVQRPLGSSRD